MLEENARWLIKMQRENLDLRKPKKFNKLMDEIKDKPGIFIRNDKGIIGHAKMQRIGTLIELHTVVVNTPFRGKGHSHKLIYTAWERWRQDPILHGKSLEEKINFSKNISEKMNLLPCQLIVFTRSASLASTLISAGFKLAIPKRKWWSLWLFKSQLAELKIHQIIHLLINRLKNFLNLLVGEEIPEKTTNTGFVKKFFQKRRRLMHQLSNLSEYKLFILQNEMQIKEWARKGGPSEEYYHPLTQIKIATFSKKNKNSQREINDWDSGEIEKIPFIDLTD